MLSFDEIWKRLSERDENVEIEAKGGEQIGPSILETVSAFSNEPGRGGGYLVLGVRVDLESLFPMYEIVGVPDADKIQADLATQCRSSFNRSIRPEMVVESVGGRKVVIAFVPEAQAAEKPVFIQARGLPKGAFRRIGSTDQQCTEDDIALFYQAQTHRTFDETVVSEAELGDLDPTAIAEYRRTRKEANPEAPELRYNDEELLHAVACATRVDGIHRPTLAGLVLFGKQAAIRRLIPMMRVDYIRVPGREWVKSPDERFESLDMLGPLMTLIPRAINAVLDDIPKAFRLPPNSDQRTDLPRVPRSAVREAIVNAVMHRSYRFRQPIQIIRYSNRLEIRNPGHSLVPDDRLGEPGSTTRNEKIAAVLHETRYAETKGSGIRAMREALSEVGLPPPTFESDRERDSFVVTFLFHHFLNEEDLRWLGRFSAHQLTEDEARALIFVRELGAMNNAAYRDINRVDTLVASGHLRRLRDLGLLEQKGKGSATYYLPTEHLLGSESAGVAGEQRVSGRLTQGLPSLTQGSPALTQGLPPQTQGFGAEAPPPELPETLQESRARLKRRAPPPEVRKFIRALCAWRPLRAEEIAHYLGRSQEWVARSYLGPMVRDRELAYTIPETPAHPLQAYKAV